MKNYLTKKKELSWIVLLGLLTDAYSQMLSPYCPTRSLLPAAFQPWAGTTFIMQPGRFKLI